MPILWLCVSVYLLCGLVALWEAEVRARPGCTPTLAEICWASIVFALTRPALVLVERLRVRV